jgi:uncharacterized protein
MGRLGIVVIFGLMATGKTTLAQALSRSLGLPAIYSDAVRKLLAGMKATTRAPHEFGQGIYSEDYSRRTYTEMLRLAQAHLARGESVILDASYKRAEERRRVRKLARSQGATTLLVYCECAREVARDRVGIRLSDPQAISDGRVELFEAQAQDFDPIMPEDRPLLRLETGRELTVVLQEVVSFVQEYLSDETQ